MIKMQNIPGLLMMLAIVSCSSLPDAKKNTDGLQVRSGDPLTGYDGYYLSQGEKFPLEKIEGKFYVVFRVADSVAVKEALDAAGATLYNVREIISHARFVEGPTGDTFTNCWTASVEGDSVQVAAALSLTVYWSPYYRHPDGEEMRVTEMFTVVLKPGTTVEQLKELAAENGVEMIGRDEFTANWYHLACTRLSSGHALQMANLFFKSGLFEDAFPNTIQRIILH
jgi:hypothetical protein